MDQKIPCLLPPTIRALQNACRYSKTLYMIFPQSAQTHPLFLPLCFYYYIPFCAYLPVCSPSPSPNSSLHTFTTSCPPKSSKNTYLVLFIEKTFFCTYKPPHPSKETSKKRKLPHFFLKNKISTSSVSATYTLTGLAPLTLTSLLANLNSAWLLDRFALPCVYASLISLGGL